MTDNTQPEALALADEVRQSMPPDVIKLWAAEAAGTIRRQHARIAELEAQLSSSGYTAADMATASAQGFRDGVASVAASAGSEPVATIKSWTNGSYWRNYNVVFHRDDLPVGTDLYTHPSPPEGMVGGWTKASQQLPPCRDDQLYIGINTAGFAGVFNVVRVIHGNTYCLMEVAEESVSIMSDLDIWQPFAPPTTSAGSGKGE